MTRTWSNESRPVTSPSRIAGSSASRSATSVQAPGGGVGDPQLGHQPARRRGGTVPAPALDPVDFGYPLQQFGLQGRDLRRDVLYLARQLVCSHGDKVPNGCDTFLSYHEQR